MQYAIATTVGRTIVKTIIRSICEKVELALAAKGIPRLLDETLCDSKPRIDF